MHLIYVPGTIKFYREISRMLSVIIIETIDF